MNHLSTRAFFTLLLSLPVVPAMAQTQTWRDDPKLVAAARQHSLDVGHALGGVSRARTAMRAGHLEVAEALGETAAEDLFRLGGEEYPMEAREVLAEIALKRGDYRESLRQAERCEPRFMVQRFGMTRALALIGLGRTDEAKAAVLKEIGTPQKPGEARKSVYTWRFPLDGDGSVAALKATALMVRAKQWLEIPEATEDLHAALLLAPTDPRLHLYAGFASSRVDSFEIAEAEYARAEKLGRGDPRLATALKLARQALRKKITETDAQKAGPTPPPGSKP